MRWQGDQARGAADPGQAPLWCRIGVVREGSAAVGNWHQAEATNPSAIWSLPGFAAEKPAPADGTGSSNPLCSSSQSVSAVNPEAVSEKPRTLAAVCGWLGT